MPLLGALECYITGFERKLSSFGTSHTEYDITVKVVATGHIRCLSKRYSQFAALRNEVAGSVGAPLLSIFPPKQLTGVNPDLRQAALQTFIAGLLEADAARSALVAFLSCGEALREAQDLLDSQVQEEEEEEDYEAEKAAGLTADRSAKRVALALLQQEKALEEAADTAAGRSTAQLCVATKAALALVFSVPDDADGSWRRGLITSVPELQAAGAIKLSAALTRSKGMEVRTGAVLMRSEYTRFGILSDDPLGLQTWRLVDNSAFELSPTYPACFAVPSVVDEGLLPGALACRSKGRMPALTWMHPTHHTPLCRSAQPMAGLKGVNEHSLEADVNVLVAIRGGSATIKIADARPKINAQ